MKYEKGGISTFNKTLCFCSDIIQANAMTYINKKNCAEKNSIKTLLMQFQHLAVTVWHQGISDENY